MIVQLTFYHVRSVVESVVEKLVDWAAAALELSSNQPVLPHAIIAFNASENNIDAELWKVNKATEKILDSLSSTVYHNTTFKKYAQFWRERNRIVETVEQLMLCYYSSVQVGARSRRSLLGVPNIIILLSVLIHIRSSVSQPRGDLS